MNTDKECTKLPSNVSEYTDEMINAYLNDKMSKITIAKYTYNGYDLKYFTKFSNDIRRKGLIYSAIVISILNGSFDEIIKKLEKAEILSSDAINIQDGKIDGDSIQRLAQVILACYKDMKEKIDKGNNLETYLSYNVPNMDALGGCYMDVNNIIFEKELYPTPALQIFDEVREHYGGYSSCLKMSIKQRKQANDKWRANMKTSTKLVLGLFND